MNEFDVFAWLCVGFYGYFVLASKQTFVNKSSDTVTPKTLVCLEIKFLDYI